MAQLSSQYRQDDLLKTAMLSQAIQPSRLFQQMMDDCMAHLLLFFRLRQNLQAARVKIQTMETRNETIESYMKHHQSERGLGNKLDTLR